MKKQVLTPHQDGKLREFLALDERVKALRGLAGVGKTSVIPHIVDRLGDVEVTAPTNRAALILRSKGLENATTIFKACMRPYFDNDYNAYSRWTSSPGNSEYPKLLAHLDEETARDKLEQGLGSSEERDASFGIKAMDHVLGWSARDMAEEGAKTIIIDEASMLNENLLLEVQRAYPFIILVGDPGQLPPVEGRSVLKEVPGVELSEVLRQASDSPILRYAYAVRASRNCVLPPLEGGIESAKVYDPSRGPILVYRNVTRRALNVGMRNRLKLPRWKLQIGEPLICKATGRKWQQVGLLNNSLWTYCGDNRVVNDLGEKVTIPRMYVEDMDEHEEQDPTACLFYLGYAMTTHSAQGSEFDSVQIAVSDLSAAQRQGEDFWRCMVYTMVTRAKTKLWMVKV